MPTSPPSGNSLLHDMDVPEGKTRQSAAGAPQGRMYAAIGLAAVALIAMAFVVYRTVSGVMNDPRREARFNLVMDSETGEVIERFPLDESTGFPAKNPKTGKLTIFPAEVCHWTKDGKAKFPPTYVILNSWLGKTGPTTCPDCGRRVTRNNPMPPDNLMQEAWDASQKK